MSGESPEGRSWLWSRSRLVLLAFLGIAGPLTSGQLAAAFVLVGAAVGLARLGRRRVAPGARHHET
jgi:hypothetical protein